MEVRQRKGEGIRKCMQERIKMRKIVNNDELRKICFLKVCDHGKFII